MSAERPAEFERHFTATGYIVTRARTLLLWHHRLRMWLPPGGHLEPNEDPVQGALREILEETGIEAEVVAPRGLLVVDEPQVIPPPEVILIEDIVREDQPFHQHIDHVYFARATRRVDFEAPIPHGPARWFGRGELSQAFSLPAPDGTLVPVAEDVRLLGLRALEAASERL
jgi:8-oxo-dGTP pyrophosphatase MutT (NUDIX family)